MSDAPPQRARRAVRAAPTTDLPVAMLYPTVPFVDAGGLLLPLSWRFLFTLWRAISDEMQGLATLQQRTAAKDEVTEAERQISNLEQRVAALEARLP